ncbi:two-component regulator propeller domain-containing protein [Ascidiimonas sp. W6]|uniref:hybrid sensor histidine kinase/response regulator transcription factor n=1 Tax=Ascidiimonas meishanensis TaxID=3128903 RepID=UPI0030ED789E
MFKKILAFLFILTNFWAVTAQELVEKQKVYKTYTKLLDQQVYSIFQDTKGFIWTGTSTGLLKYDGYHFVSYKNIPEDPTSISGNWVNSIAEDSLGQLWMAIDGGGISKFNPLTENFKRYTQTPSDSTLISENTVFTVFIDSKQRIWAGHRKGIDLYNPKKDQFERVLHPPENNDNKKMYRTGSIAEDLDGKLWLGTGEAGLVCFNPETLKNEESYVINPKGNKLIYSYPEVLSVVCDNEGKIWFAGGSGIAYVDKDKKPLLVENNEKNLSKNFDSHYLIFKTKTGKILSKLSSDSRLKILTKKTTALKPEFEYTNYPPIKNITTLLEDNAESLWVGNNDGLTYFGAKSKPFEFYYNLKEKTTKSNDYSDFVPNKILTDSKGYLWFEDISEGLIKLNPETGKWEAFKNLSSNFYKGDDDKAITYIIEDRKGNIWLFLKGELAFLDIKTKESYFDNAKIQDWEGNPIRIKFQNGLEDKDGIIWILTEGRLAGYKPQKKGGSLQYVYDFWVAAKPDAKLPGYSISTIHEDQNQNLFVGFEDVGLYKLNKNTHTFTKINYEIKGINNTEASAVSCIYQNQKNMLWIGTFGGLFKYNIEEKTSTHYGLNEGLPDTTIHQIIEDDLGYFWIPTNQGLAKFNPKTETFKVYDKNDGLKQSIFKTMSASINKKNGSIYLPGNKGINVFDPKKIHDNPHIPKIVITNFEKHSAKGDFTTLPGINFLNHLKLPYNERDFTIEIAALDYTNPAKNKYAYWLEGYNTKWVEIGTRREVTFTNLSPGSYNLKVKGSNNDGIWNQEGKSLQIIILPPWWLTWWAYSFYAIIILSLFYAVYKYRINQLENIRIKELDAAKRTMYTNITHEFRTPLTVITGINKELRNYAQGAHKEHFDLIDRSSQNMLYLVNQLLELRKLEIGKMKVHYIQGNIIAYLKYIAETFKTYAKTKGISLHFVCISEELNMDYDPDKLLMILSNLLSNAIKHSKPDSDIYLQIDQIEDKLQIRVVDSGEGIPEKELPYIFDRFYKVQSNKNDNIDGVGIGLAVTKELVQLLEGEISVSSQNKLGSIFTFTLPIQNKHPLVQSPKLQEMDLESIQKDSIDLTKEIIDSSPEDTLQLLIIEDNTAIINYLSMCLKDTWSLDIARDGQEGIDKAFKIVPDIILCDLMMPNVDGFKVLDILKNDTRTSHIPIVILTAKADDDSRIEAYKKGADAYLLKPFNKDELHVILEKLVAQRKVLQQRYQSQTDLIFSDGITLGKEDIFMKKLEELILYEDTKRSYNVSQLCKDLAMSRTQLHNKIKALTGRSTSIFVRSLRLRKGKYLLEHSHKSISEIAYEVGFNNPSYFTKSFTEEFGIPPSSLRK